MFTIYLQCSNGHSFEGWYESSHDYYSRLSTQDVSCPVCDSGEVFRRSSSSSPLSQMARYPHAPASTLTPEVRVQKALDRLLDRIRKDQAAAIAQPSVQEEEHTNDEEGVPFFKVFIPDLDKN